MFVKECEKYFHTVYFKKRMESVNKRLKWWYLFTYLYICVPIYAFQYFRIFSMTNVYYFWK